MKPQIKSIKTVTVFVNGEEIGYADQIITNTTGSYYASDGEYLQDNGEYVPVDGYGVEVR